MIRPLQLNTNSFTCIHTAHITSHLHNPDLLLANFSICDFSYVRLNEFANMSSRLLSLHPPPTTPPTPTYLQSNPDPICIADSNQPVKKKKKNIIWWQNIFSSRTPTASPLCKILLWQHTNISVHGQILHNTPSHIHAGAFQHDQAGWNEAFAWQSRFPNEHWISSRNWKLGSRFFSAFVSVLLHFDGPFMNAVCGEGIFLFYFFLPHNHQEQRHSVEEVKYYVSAH